MWRALGEVVLLGIGVMLVIVGLRGSGGFVPGSGSGNGVSAQPIVPPVSVSPTAVAKLPLATTFTRTPAAPLDQDPFAVTDGVVVHPLTQQVVYAAPGRQAVAVLPATQLGGPTWVPVVQSSPGWYQVLLPSRPDRATGWLFTGGTAAAQLEIRQSGYLIRVNTGARTLTVDDNGKSLGTWTVAVGTPSTPTPPGRTFILALVAPPQPTYSPLILPLGTHSNTFSTFGGGPGTVGLHGWPNPAVFGHAVSNGCVRVPATALHLLAIVPLGTLVVITQ